jgi:hypothetical protein
VSDEWFTNLLQSTALLDEDRAWISARLRQGAPYSRECLAWFEICAERGREGPEAVRIATTALVGLRRLFNRALDHSEGRHVWRLFCGELSMDRQGVFRIDYEPIVWRTGRLVDVSPSAWVGWRGEVERVAHDPRFVAKEWGGIGCVSCGGESFEGICDRCNGVFVVIPW